MTYPSSRLEEALWKQGYTVVAGIDEAGRGALAGPVMVGAVVFAPGQKLPSNINDSKKLTSRQREYLAEKIKEIAKFWAIGAASNKFIDCYGICPAIMEAAKRAIERLGTQPNYYLFDYMTQIYQNHQPRKNIIRGDSLSITIAAASILAKVERDHYMIKLHQENDCYGFDRHKGYGTKVHFENINKYKAGPYHRLSFLRSFFFNVKIKP